MNALQNAITQINGENRSQSIANINDGFRLHNVVQFMVTPGIIESGKQIDIIHKVQKFNDFSEDNDPYGEHDFGSFDFNGERIFWKIDYYDQNLEYGLD